MVSDGLIGTVLEEKWFALCRDGGMHHRTVAITSRDEDETIEVDIRKPLRWSMNDMEAS